MPLRRLNLKKYIFSAHNVFEACHIFFVWPIMLIILKESEGERKISILFIDAGSC
jgi:hypothetical protein